MHVDNTKRTNELFHRIKQVSFKTVCERLPELETMLQPLFKLLKDTLR